MPLHSKSRHPGPDRVAERPTEAAAHIWKITEALRINMRTFVPKIYIERQGGARAQSPGDAASQGLMSQETGRHRGTDMERGERRRGTDMGRGEGAEARTCGGGEAEGRVERRHIQATKATGLAQVQLRCGGSRILSADGWCSANGMWNGAGQRGDLLLGGNGGISKSWQHAQPQGMCTPTCTMAVIAPVLYQWF